jgi:hypothetical protein
MDAFIIFKDDDWKIVVNLLHESPETSPLHGKIIEFGTDCAVYSLTGNNDQICMPAHRFISAEEWLLKSRGKKIFNFSESNSFHLYEDLVNSLVELAASITDYISKYGKPPYVSDRIV